MAGFNCLLSKLCSTSCIAGIPIHLCLFLVLLSDTKICVCGKCNQSIDREALLWHYTQNRLNRRLLIKEAICHSFSLSVFLSLLSLSLCTPPHTDATDIYCAERGRGLDASKPVWWQFCGEFGCSKAAAGKQLLRSCAFRQATGFVSDAAFGIAVSNFDFNQMTGSARGCGEINHSRSVCKFTQHDKHPGRLIRYQTLILLSHTFHFFIN